MDQIQPKNYLVESILTTICCCLPLGIVGIVYASQVNSKFALGDYEGAVQASNEAKKWMTWGIVAGVIINFGVYLIWGSVFVAALSEGLF
jgi:hypothetical protein